MHNVAVLVESLIEPHTLVLEGLEYYRINHSLDWATTIVTREPRILDERSDTFFLAIHSQMVNASLVIPPSRPALCVFGDSTERCHRCVTLDGPVFGNLAAAHFNDLGLRHAGFIPSSNPRVRAALAGHYAGLAASCRKHGIILEELPPGSNDGNATLLSALRQHAKPLGIYCATNGQAAWLRDRCVEAGLELPNEIAIIGTSDHPHHCQRSRPTISSIAFPWFVMGIALGQALHRQMSGIPRPEPQTLRPVRVIERETTAGLQPSDPFVAAALTWLQQHVREPRPLSACAGALKCSVPTLSRKFRTTLGTSVKQAHARLRYREAMRLLADSTEPLARIAQACGYVDAASLSVAFKRHSGLSPGRWRMAARS